MVRYLKYCEEIFYPMDENKNTKNPAEEHFINGIRLASFGKTEDELLKGIQELESALRIGLPANDEVAARAFIGGTYLQIALSLYDDNDYLVNSSQFSKGIEEIERAIFLDSSGRYGFFLNSLANRTAFLSKLDGCYCLQANSIERKQGIDAAIDYLTQKINLLDRLDGNYIGGIYGNLGNLYAKKSNKELAQEAFKKASEVEIRPGDEFQLQTKQNAEYNLKILINN